MLQVEQFHKKKNPVREFVYYPKEQRTVKEEIWSIIYICAGRMEVQLLLLVFSQLYPIGCAKYPKVVTRLHFKQKHRAGCGLRKHGMPPSYWSTLTTHQWLFIRRLSFTVSLKPEPTPPGRLPINIIVKTNFNSEEMKIIKACTL